MADFTSDRNENLTQKFFSFPPTSIQLFIANQIFKILFQKSGEITPARYPIVEP